MNILLFFWGGGEGGDASAVIDLAVALKATGAVDFRLVAYAEAYPEEFANKAQAAGLLSGQDFFMISSPASAWAESGLSPLSFDLVHVHHGRSIPKRSDIKPLRTLSQNLPLVLTAHGPLPLKSIKYGGIKSQISRWLSPLWFRCLVVPSNAKLQEWKSFTPLSRKVVAIPNIVRPLEHSDRGFSRKSLGIGNEKVVIYCSRIEPEKDPLTFIKAIALASAKNKSVVGLMAGSGSLESKCLQLITDGKAPVRMLGHLSNVSPVYAAADVFVQTSIHESYCITLRHAVQLGLPSVASDLEIFHQLYPMASGIKWFRTQDPEDCAHKILEQIGSPRTTVIIDEQDPVQMHLDLYHKVLRLK